MGDFYVRNPLRAAAAWNAKFTGYEGVVGVDGELDGGVKFQLRYDWDTNHGFHNFYHTSDEGKAWYYRACNFLNNRKNDDEDLAAETFVSGRI
ncbi:hypothetical protein HFD88_006400 [Aspergillus terreus]|nr:hypothetical protein HFD88_006400 [Aspergillus terreus]